MNIIVLNASNDSLEIFLGEAHNVSGMNILAIYADATSTSIEEANDISESNGTTDVTIVSAPAASTQRIIKEIIIYNGDDITHEFTIQLDVSATEYILYVGTLTAGSTWVMSEQMSSQIELANDPSPQLGGDLDLNGHSLDFPTTANISDVLDDDTMADNSATKLATQQSIKAYTDNVTDAMVQNDGWVDANQTWTYASATTITVPSGAAAIYSIGDKIRMKQTAGTYVYFYVITVADTLLTVTGGSDYTVANETITDNYYSKAVSPVAFPTTHSWSLSDSSLVGFSGTPTFVCVFTIIGPIVRLRMEANGTSNNAATSMTLPVAASVSAYGIFRSIVGSTAAAGESIASTTTLTFYPDFIQNGWATSGDKYVQGANVIYNI